MDSEIKEPENKTIENIEENNIVDDTNLGELQNENQAPPKEIKEEHKKEHKKHSKEKDELIKANLELKEKVLRITAEMQNMRRRYDIDIANLHKYDGIDLVEKLLPIIDNFERALKIKTDVNTKFLDGFKMIYDNLISILTGKGITEIEVLNKPFDPNIMNAVATEINNELDNNTVLEVLQKGYIYNERIIRPAMVKVSEKESE